jgi:hypothetical protein
MRKRITLTLTLGLAIGFAAIIIYHLAPQKSGFKVISEKITSSPGFNGGFQHF